MNGHGVQAQPGGLFICEHDETEVGNLLTGRRQLGLLLSLDANTDLNNLRKIGYYKLTRGQGELRFSRLNVCIAFLDRYSSYGSYKAPLIQREFEFELKQFT